MKKENCTRGPVISRSRVASARNSLAYRIDAPDFPAFVRACPRKEGGSLDEIEANAELIAEAFNVLHETGCTPRELADMVAELHAALSASNEWLEGALLDEPEDFDNTELNDAVAANLKALSKYQPKTHA